VRVAVAASGAAVLSMVATVVVLASAYRAGSEPGGVPRALGAMLTERRVMLWNDALRLFLERPLAGVGPGRFPVASAVARANPDTPWPHNEVLHFAAEAGLPGLLLVLALLAWGFARLWWGAGERGAAIAALALGAAGVHANIDYVLHYPAVPLALAALVGAGSACGASRAGRGSADPRRAVSRSARGRTRA
jgi:O-antigen ligase